MKKLLLFILLTNSAFANFLSGTVSLSNEKKVEGVLYIFAKKENSRMPVVVKRINNPVYPQKFRLTEDDKMIKNIPFIGPFIITARISPSGGVMDKSGVEVSSKGLVKLGTKDIDLNLK